MSEDDDARTSYLAGEANSSLPAGERAGLDELRGVLGAPAVDRTRLTPVLRRGRISMGDRKEEPI